MKSVWFRRALSTVPRGGGEMAARWTYGLASGALLALLLSVAGLLTELLISTGDLTVSAAESAAVQAWAGPPDREDGSAATYRDRGLIAWVLRMQRTPLASWAEKLYRSAPVLQSNGRCLAALAAAGMALAALWLLVRFYHDRVVHLAAQGVATRLRSELRRQSLLVEAGELASRETSLVELFTFHVESVRRGLAAWWSAVPSDLVWLACLAALALRLHVWIALAAILFAALGWLLLGVVGARTRERQALAADHAGQHMSTLVEVLGQARLLSGHLLEELPGQPFAELLEQQHQAAVRQAAAAAPPLAPRLFAAFAAGLLAWLIGANVLGAPALLHPADAVYLVLVLAAGIRPLGRLFHLDQNIQSADASAQSIVTYLDRAPPVGQTTDAAPLGPVAEQLVFDHVTLLDSGGQKLLDDVSLAIPAGGRTAVVAADHATPLGLACLLSRFCDPHQGRVLFDHSDIRHATIASLRSQTALVLRNDLLFPGTVSENIRLGDERFTNLQMTEAAKLVRADDFISVLPQGFETIIGNHGPRLASDQALRIGLARVLLRNPSVVVYEEPSEGLGPEQAAQIDAAVAAVARNRTMIVLPSRLSTLRNIDRIVLFQHGKLVGQGTHAELLQDNDLYRHLVYLRFNEFRSVA